MDLSLQTYSCFNIVTPVACATSKTCCIDMHAFSDSGDCPLLIIIETVTHG